MAFSRRSFLKVSGIITSAAALGGLSLLKGCAFSRNNKPFGIQLWSLRDVIGAEPRGTLAQIADFGYNQIESYEGEMGIYWGMTNTEFKNYLDDLGLEIVSSHANVFEDFERKADEAAEIGIDYLVCPWIGPQESMDNYKEMADQFNKIGEVAREKGIRFAYHNHDYSFKMIDGEYPQDILIENTDPGLVDFQLDIYWVVAAGEDPLHWIEKHSGRYTSSHVKDLMNGDEPESTMLGTGEIDFPPILEKAKQHGMEYFFTEQEDFTDTNPVDAARENADFMRELNW